MKLTIWGIFLMVTCGGLTIVIDMGRERLCFAAPARVSFSNAAGAERVGGGIASSGKGHVSLMGGSGVWERLVEPAPCGWLSWKGERTLKR